VCIGVQLVVSEVEPRELEKVDLRNDSPGGGASQEQPVESQRGRRRSPSSVDERVPDVDAPWPRPGWHRRRRPPHLPFYRHATLHCRNQPLQAGEVLHPGGLSAGAISADVSLRTRRAGGSLHLHVGASTLVRPKSVLCPRITSNQYCVPGLLRITVSPDYCCSPWRAAARANVSGHSGRALTSRRSWPWRQAVIFPLPRLRPWTWPRNTPRQARLGARGSATGQRLTRSRHAISLPPDA